VSGSRVQAYRLPALSVLLFAVSAVLSVALSGAWIVLAWGIVLGTFIASTVAGLRFGRALSRSLPQLATESGVFATFPFYTPRILFRLADRPEVEADPQLAVLGTQHQWLFVVFFVEMVAGWALTAWVT